MKTIKMSNVLNNHTRVCKVPLIYDSVHDFQGEWVLDQKNTHTQYYITYKMWVETLQTLHKSHVMLNFYVAWFM